MKMKLKSALNRKRRLFFVALLPAFLLSACADVREVNWLTGEPVEAVLDAPRTVKKPEENDRNNWPNLASVPKEGPDFTDTDVRAQEKDYLLSDKYQSDAEKARLRGILLPQPASEY